MDQTASGRVVRPTARGRRLLVLTLTALIILLVAAGTIGEIARLGFGYDTALGLVRLSGLGQEANVPTWFASATLIMGGMFAGLIALLPVAEVRAASAKWSAFSAVLVLMSLDETAVIHESLPYFLALSLLSPEGGPWYVIYAWIVPGAAVLGFVVWWFVPLWRTFPPPLRRRMTLAAVVFFGGAFGLELAEAAWASQFDTNHFGYSALWTTQEALEMAGVAMLIVGLYDYLLENGLAISLTCEPKTTGLSDLGACAAEAAQPIE